MVKLMFSDYYARGMDPIDWFLRVLGEDTKYSREDEIIYLSKDDLGKIQKYCVLRY